MYFTFPCPQCGKKLKVQEEAAGRRCACPYCKHSIAVPEPPTEPEPPPRQDGTEAFKGIGEPRERPGVADKRKGPPKLPRTPRGGASRSSWADRTDVSMVVTGLLGLVATVAFYAAVFPLRNVYFGELFLNRGWVPFVEVSFLWWSAAILFFKSRKLKRQRASMLFDLLPNDIAEDITEDTADRFIEHIHGLPVEPRESFLVNRVLRGLEHFRVRKSNPEVAAMLASHSEIDGNAVQSSYTLLNVFIWAIPILGFIGTVIGISSAVGAFSGTLADTADIGQLKDALNDVTSGLATAFDTTLLALILSMLVMFPSSSLQKSEEDLLNWVDEYCNENLLKRLNDGGLGDDGQQRPESSAAALRRAIDAALVPHHAELKAHGEKLEALGGSLADRIVEGYDRVHEQLQQRQDESAEQVEDLDVMVAAFQERLRDLAHETGTVHQQAAESMRQSADSLRAWCTALEQGLGGLNAVLEKLGEKQVVVQAPPRRGWLFWRNSRE